MVTVSGANLTSAGDYPGFIDGNLLCRFGGPEGEIVEATPVAGRDAVQCEAPSNPRQDGGTEVGQENEACAVSWVCSMTYMRLAVRCVSWIFEGTLVRRIGHVPITTVILPRPLLIVPSVCFFY